MTRFIQALSGDIRLQIRYGFYYVATIITILWVLILSQIDSSFFGGFLPIFILGNLNIGTFYFMGAIILFEKNESTLDGIVVSPLRFSEFLGSKVFGLVILGLFENLILVYLILKINLISAIMLSISIISIATIFSLFGFSFVVRYESLTEYFFPSILLVSFLQLPILQVFIQNELLHLGLGFHPLNPAFILTSIVLTPSINSYFIYGLLGSITWIIASYKLSQRSWEKYIIRRINI